MPRLEPEQIVDVCLAGGWRRTVRVVGVGEAHVDVLPIDGPAALPAGIELWEATIEWRAERGLARAKGVITDTSDALRFLETAGEVVMQRRQFFRVRCGVTVTVAGADRDPILTEAVDLSVGGMLLARADSLRMGDRVRFALTLAEGEVLVGGAGVVRATPFGHRALSFEALHGNQEQRLGHFVADIQRRQAALRAEPARGSRPRAR
jgi:PilZ domain